MVVRSRMEAKLAWNGDFLYDADIQFSAVCGVASEVAYGYLVSMTDSGKLACSAKCWGMMIFLTFEPKNM